MIGRKSIKIDAIRLDDYFKNYKGRIDFIKMDIEGAEGLALEGMSNLLKKNKKVKIFTEFQPFGLATSGISPEKYLSLLLDRGYKLYQLDEQKQKIKPVNISKLVKTFTPKKKNHANLLCLNE
jgi:hypothetical protein